MSREKHTGYRVGGHLSIRNEKNLRIFMEEGIAGLPRILINAGGRGCSPRCAPAELIRVLKPVAVKVAI